MKLVLYLLFLFICAASVQGDSICYDGIGCFTDDPPWGDTNQRPFRFLPDDPSHVNTRFYLDTRKQSDVEIFNYDMAGVASTTFDGSLFTRIIIHGYIDNGDVGWMEDMSQSFLQVSNENIIRVGWLGGSLQLNYMSSAVDTEIVGGEVGVMIRNLIAAFGMSEIQFHCIGHSLGAHTCGYVSNFVQDPYNYIVNFDPNKTQYPPIYRISGLDPAGPYFETGSTLVKLDHNDAIFVDVIHTDAEDLQDLGLGTNDDSGDVDFWPNDGMKQPGCDQNALSTIVGVDGVVDGTRDFVACNHIRAIKFFTESITTSCFFKSFPCLNYDDFVHGDCTGCEETGCPQLGVHAMDYMGEVAEADTYLSTNPGAPFCQYMTDIVVRMADDSKTITGEIYITLYGFNGATEQEQLGEETIYDMRPGQKYTSLVYYDVNPGSIDYIKFLWIQKEIDIINSYVTVSWVQLKVGATQNTLCFCPADGTKMKEETRYAMYPCNKCS